MEFTLKLGIALLTLFCTTAHQSDRELPLTSSQRKTAIDHSSLNSSDILPANSLCPDVLECSCYDSGTTEVRADCVGESLTYIPGTLPDNLTALQIRRTSLRSVDGTNLTKYVHLTELNLPDNGLQEILPNSLDALVKLEIFIASTNNLTHIHVDGLFSTTLLLQNIDLRNNHLTRVPTFPAYLVYLRLLDLQQNFVQAVVANQFAKCPGLTQLYLSENSLAQLEPNSFSALTQLTELYLDSNQITSLSDGVFNSLKSLQVLRLSSNEIDRLEANIFSSLASLKELHLDGNRIQHIAQGAFNYLLNLQLLYLSSNFITDLGGNIFTLASLQQLELQDNHIITINDLAFEFLTSLEILQLNNNNLSVVPTSALQRLPMVQFLQLSGNRFSAIGAGAFSGITRLGELFLDYLSIMREIHVQAFDGIDRLTRLSLNNCPQLEELSSQHLSDSKHPWIEWIHIYNNGFRSLEEATFRNKDRLILLDLHGNPFHCDCSLEWMPRVVLEDVSWASHWKDQSTPPRCRTPDHLSGHDITDMLPNDMTCEDTRISLISPQHQVAYFGGNATFQAALVNGLPTTLWLLANGEVIKPPMQSKDTRIKISESVDSQHTVLATFDLDNATLTDEGIYTMIATNIMGNITTDFNLTVLSYEKPTDPPMVGGSRHIHSGCGQFGLLVLIIISTLR